MRTNLSRNFGRQSPFLRAEYPLEDDMIRRVAPSIFADEPHDSRSARYTYIPTIEVLNSLRKEGFEPFMVAQTRVRDEGRRDHTKHMIRLRHANQIVGKEADEIILLNSHDGTSSYQMLAGMFRFVCMNGLVCGEVQADFRVPHKGDVIGSVIEGAYTVLDNFKLIAEKKEEMQSIQLQDVEQFELAKAALTIRYDERERSPISEQQLLWPRRIEDDKNDLWSSFNRIQENMLKGGLQGRTANRRRTTTRAVQGIDQSIKLNKELWGLAQAMAELKA